MTRSLSKDPIVAALDAAVKPGTVLAAVSGGPDSMAMLNALCLLAEKRGDIHVAVAHFDHGLRPDSDGDIHTVESLAFRHGARVITERSHVAKHARESRQSIEAAARELRYSFLERAADLAGADVIATAHTRDDQHETIVMRMMRGAGDRGLRGIHSKRGRIVRPLLSVTHAETVQHCRDYDIQYVVDPSNADRRFFRNRVRAHVLPELRVAQPDLDEILDEISDAASGSFEQARLDTNDRIGALRRGGAAWCMPIPAFDGLNQSTRVHLLMRVFRVIGTNDNVAEGHYAAMLRLIHDGPTGKSVDLPEIRVRRDHDALVFVRRSTDVIATGETEMMIPGAAQLGEWTLTADRITGAQALCEVKPARGVARTKPHGRHELFAYVVCSAPLTVRFARPGDRIRPFGMSGHKKLSDLFIDRKIPHRVRSRIPVVECGGEIVWVVGVATSESARFEAGTPDVVRIRAAVGGPA